MYTFVVFQPLICIYWHSNLPELRRDEQCEVWLKIQEKELLIQDFTKFMLQNSKQTLHDILLTDNVFILLLSLRLFMKSDNFMKHNIIYSISETSKDTFFVELCQYVVEGRTTFLSRPFFSHLRKCLYPWV